MIILYLITSACFVWKYRYWFLARQHFIIIFSVQHSYYIERLLMLIILLVKSILSQFNSIVINARSQWLSWSAQEWVDRVSDYDPVTCIAVMITVVVRVNVRMVTVGTGSVTRSTRLGVVLLVMVMVAADWGATCRRHITRRHRPRLHQTLSK